MPEIVDKSEVMARNRIDGDRLRAYLDFLQRLTDAGLDLRASYHIRRPLDDRLDRKEIPRSSNHPFLHCQ